MGLLLCYLCQGAPSPQVPKREGVSRGTARIQDSTAQWTCRGCRCPTSRQTDTSTSPSTALPRISAAAASSGNEIPSSEERRSVTLAASHIPSNLPPQIPED